MLSVILQIALVISPGMTRPSNGEGMVMLRSNVSDSSAMLSIVTDTLTTVIVEPAIKVAVIGLES